MSVAISYPASLDVAQMYDALISEDVTIRLDAVSQFVQAGYTSKRLLSLLRRGALDANLLVMDACVRAIRELFSDKIALELLHLWKHGPVEFRASVSQWLARDGGVLGRDTLCDKLSFLTFDFEPYLFSALARHHGAFMLSFCNDWSQHSNWQERAVATRALGMLPGEANPDEYSTLQAGCCELLLPLCDDPDEQVRIAALRSLRLLDRDEAKIQARRFLNDNCIVVRVAAIEVLGELEDVDSLPKIREFLSGHDDDIHVEAFHFVSHWDTPKNKLVFARRLIHDNNDELVPIAADILQQFGDETDVPSLRTRIAWDDEDIARSAFLAASSLAQEELLRLVIIDGLCSSLEEIFGLAYTKLVESYETSQAIPCLLEALPSCRQQGGRWLLERLQLLAPQRVVELIQPEHIQQFPWPTDLQARQNVLFFYQQLEGVDTLPLLERGLADSESLVRASALRYLKERAPKRCHEVAIQQLNDPCPVFRLSAVKVLADATEPWLVDDLLPRTRDTDAHVRREALKVLSKFDDPRILSELVSSLSDIDSSVKSAASTILNEQTEKPVPLLRTFGRRGKRRARWLELHEKAKEINRWASKIGQQLLGRPVRVFQHRQGFGYTVHSDKNEAVEIYVSDSPVTSGHPYGEEIMKGLVLHEVGHHLYDIGVRGHLTMEGIARSEGHKDLYDMLIDERLERGLRSRRPEWGSYFDRLASYAFAQNAHFIPVAEYARLLETTEEDILTRLLHKEIPGRLLPMRRTRNVRKVVLRDRDLLVLPNAIPPVIAFLWCLRCGFDPQLHPNPNVGLALNLVPAHLKDMRHSELLQLVRKIGALLGTDDVNRQRMTEILSLLNVSPHLRGMFGRMLRGLGEAKQLPDWMQQIPAGIRSNPVDEVQERPKFNRTGKGGRVLNLSDELGFPELEKTVRLEQDPAAYRRLVGPIRKHIRQMRSHFESLGRLTIEHYASRRGRRLDIARVKDFALLNRPNVLIHSYDEVAPDLYLGLLIDRSGSMSEGRMELAKSFAALLAESARGLRGIEGDIHAFDDATLFQLGNFQRNAIEQLDAFGGNNDAGALQRAANLAMKSGKRNRLLIMISDGMPAECSVASLQSLVQKVTQENQIICAQVAVAPLPQICFPNYLDVSQYSLDEAVTRFGRMIKRLTRGWR